MVTPHKKVASGNVKAGSPVLVNIPTPVSKRLKRGRTKDSPVRETLSKKRKSRTESKDQKDHTPEPRFTVSYAQAVEFIDNYEKAEVPKNFKAPALKLEHQDTVQASRAYLGATELNIVKQQEAFNSYYDAEFILFEDFASKYSGMEDNLEAKTEELPRLRQLRAAIDAQIEAQEAEITTLERELNDQKSMIKAMARHLGDRFHNQPVYKMMQRVATTVPQIFSYQPLMANLLVERAQKIRTLVKASHISPEEVFDYGCLLDDESKERQEIDANESQSNGSNTSDDEFAMYPNEEMADDQDWLAGDTARTRDHAQDEGEDQTRQTRQTDNDMTDLPHRRFSGPIQVQHKNSTPDRYAGWVLEEYPFEVYNIYVHKETGFTRFKTQDGKIHKTRTEAIEHDRKYKLVTG